MRDYHEFLDEILIDEDQLRARVAALGAQISADYTGTRDLLLVCVLKGGVMFLTDLMKHITIPHAIEFMAVSSYGVSVRESSGVAKIDLDVRQPITDCHVIIVEDIIDSGTTLSYIRRLLETRAPASLKICTLLNKPSRRVTPVKVDYVGFEIADKFVFGYGLDLDEMYRNLPFIGVVREGAKWNG
ncbi:MAG: hypoxanthine phosphoribosyltransferase [Anaerolineae bacterium]|nr:hypoxanthine phosphoribosyltransferase [Anaerolineae bacterium]